MRESKNIHNSLLMIQNSSKNGFTLVELMIAVAIFVILVIATSAFFISLYKEQASDIARIKRIDVAGKTIEIMSSEIRKMNRAENGIYPLEITEEQTLVFYSDIDSDGLTERVEYFLNGIVLEKKLVEPGDDLDYLGEEITTTIVDGVRNGAEPVFKYYDENYTGSEDSLSEPINITNVKVIEIIFDLNADEKNLSNSLRIETKIHPRNLKNFN